MVKQPTTIVYPLTLPPMLITIVIPQGMVTTIYLLGEALETSLSIPLQAWLRGQHQAILLIQIHGAVWGVHLVLDIGGITEKQPIIIVYPLTLPQMLTIIAILQGTVTTTYLLGEALDNF
jgi:hypothetical protein